MPEQEKKSSGAGKFFLGAALGAIAGAVAGKFISGKMEKCEYDEKCNCDGECEDEQPDIEAEVKIGLSKKDTDEKSDGKAEKSEKSTEKKPAERAEVKEEKEAKE